MAWAKLKGILGGNSSLWTKRYQELFHSPWKHLLSQIFPHQLQKISQTFKKLKLSTRWVKDRNFTLARIQKSQRLRALTKRGSKEPKLSCWESTSLKSQWTWKIWDHLSIHREFFRLCWIRIILKLRLTKPNLQRSFMTANTPKITPPRAQSPKIEI